MDADIAAFRRFNRFHTRLIGVLDARFLGTDATLPEARLLFEIAGRQPVTASDLAAALDMDPGFVSRILSRFARRGWLARTRDRDDARARPLRLSPAGAEAMDAIDRRQRDAIAAILDPLDPLARRDLIEALSRARLLLDPGSGGPFAIRPFRIGDAPAIAARQSALYAAERGWDRGLELVECETITRFLRGFDPERENCWIAEIDAVSAGAVFLTDEGDNLARLRLLHVEPFARRRGIGDALVATCVGCARERGYSRLTLWTHAVLEPARRLYARHGFRLRSSAPHREFGDEVLGETWTLDLAAPAGAAP